MSSSSQPHQPPPLNLTIRFSTSIPDLDLDIPSPQATTVLALKHLLRKRIASSNRLRLIHQGRLLPDSAAISSVLKPLPPPPRADHDRKGKAVVSPPRLYVNCSIGDELSAEDLANEEASAARPPIATSVVPVMRPEAAPPRPRGFDRLLQSGFTTSEISTLRTQFASIHTARFTPDAMPSPDTLRSMEDAWIDNNSGGLPTDGGGGGSGFEDEYAGLASSLDILFRGMIVGFFFPLGSLTWLMRQEGIWSKRWQIFVAFGVVFSLFIGVTMRLAGD